MAKFDKQAEAIFASVFQRPVTTQAERSFLTSAADRKSGAALQGALEFKRQQGGFASTRPEGAAGQDTDAIPQPEGGGAVAQQSQTQGQEGLAGAANSVVSGAQAVRQGFNDLNTEREKVKKAQSLLFDEREQFRARQAILQDPDYQDFIKFKAELAGGVQTTETGTRIKPGITDPLTVAEISAEERGELASRASLLGDTLRTGEKFVGQQIENIADLTQQDLDTAQQNFNNANTTFKSALSLAENDRAEVAQQVELFGLTANQRANLSVDLIAEGFDSKDVAEVLDRFSGGTTPGSNGMRTDRHNNPTAFTSDIAKQAGLVEGVDYTVGDPFPNNPNLFTARLIGDPIEQTIKVIDRIGFKTQAGKDRGTYLNKIPEHQNWSNLNDDQKKDVIKKMYQIEGGSGSLFDGAKADGIEERRQANLAAEDLNRFLTKEELAQYGAPAGTQFKDVIGLIPNSKPPDANTTNLAKAGRNSLNESKKIMGMVDSEGDDTDRILRTQLTLGKFGGRQLKAALDSMVLNYVFVLSGKQVSEKEIERFDHLRPNRFDSDATIRFKFDQFAFMFNAILDQKQGSLDLSLDTIANSDIATLGRLSKEKMQPTVSDDSDIVTAAKNKFNISY